MLISECPIKASHNSSSSKIEQSPKQDKVRHYKDFKVTKLICTIMYILQKQGLMFVFCQTENKMQNNGGVCAYIEI
jgi:hypothetical protein